MEPCEIENQAVTTAKALIKQRDFRAAIGLLQPLAVEGQTDPKIWAILGNAYIKTKQPDKAIALLKPLHVSGHGDSVTIATLGNAYIHDQNPKAAIALLKPLHDSGRGNTITTNILGNAAAIQKDHAIFDSVKGAIEPKTTRDYLEAKLLYLDNQPQKALRVLRPHIEGDIKNMSSNMCGIFLNVIPDKSPLQEFLKQCVGEETFARMMEHKELWRDNPLRAELSDVQLSDGRMIHILGATPVSHADRIKAGMPIAAQHGPRISR